MILVAGGTGHLGVVLAHRLVAGGHRVRVLTRDPERARGLLDPAVELVPGDARKAGDVRVALEGIDSVVSAITGFGPGAQGPRAVDHQANLELIRAAEETGVRRFVLVSIDGASRDHPMELHRMKHLAEEALRSSALEWVILRPNVFMELWVEIAGGPVAEKGRATVFGRGDNPINFNSVRDVAQFAERALTEPALARTVLSVGGPENLTFNQFVDRIGRAAGRQVSVRHVPLPLMRVTALAMRRLKPDVAGLIEAGIAMDSAPMAFESAGLQERFPDVRLTSLQEVLERRFGATAHAARTLGAVRPRPAGR
ncbi:MAG TPA: SDR family oxidoreductase [Candidatus Dormibacteraeota bacterium]